MTAVHDLINGWEIRDCDDSHFGVYFCFASGMIAGPFRTRQGAILAALHLPMPIELGLLRDFEEVELTKRRPMRTLVPHGVTRPHFA